LHFKVITETAPEVLTPLLIAGGLAALAIVAFLLFLKFRHKIGPKNGKDRPGRRFDRAPPKKKRKRP
jgi:hypothetical protein